MIPRDDYDEPACSNCGSSARWVRCSHCGGEGTDGHDCGEDTCCCLYPEDNLTCDICEGEGGWYQCLSSQEWCEANPLESAIEHSTESGP